MFFAEFNRAAGKLFATDSSLMATDESEAEPVVMYATGGFQRRGGTTMIRGLLVFASSMVFASIVANSQMVSNSAIQNDPTKEALCTKRAKIKKPVSFLIDQNYVNSVRAAHPDTTFVAADGIIPELVECRVNEKSGVFELESLSSEENLYWHLVRPEQFTPGIHTAAGQVQADDVCFKAAREKVNQADFDHSFGYTTDVNEITLDESPWYLPGVKIAGMKAERYDIAVAGRLFYKSSGPDLNAFRVSCLLSPMLEVKAVQAGAKTADRTLKLETRFEAPSRK